MGFHSILEHLGLAHRSAFLRDPQLAVALIVGTIVAFIIGQRATPLAHGDPVPWTILGMVVWGPLLEELLFRGVIQGELRRRGGLHTWLGLTQANLVTSLLFAAAHLVSQSAAWSLAVFAPSLVFGHFRDRHDSLWSPLILHALYNGGFILPSTL
jgi:membrane protease YdiL (CAAX protease family)